MRSGTQPFGARVDWRFTTPEARTKLRNLYPAEKQ